MPWQVPVSGILSLTGLGISVYLTVVHYVTPSLLVCPNSGAIDCAAVITSPQSVLFGLPIAVYGDIWHAVMFLFFLPWAWYASAGLGDLGRRAGRWIGWFRFGGILVAIGFVIYLIYLELYEIHKICLWCTSVHITTFLLLVTVVSSSGWSLGQGFGSRVGAALGSGGWDEGDDDEGGNHEADGDRNELTGDDEGREASERVSRSTVKAVAGEAEAETGRVT